LRAALVPTWSVWPVASMGMGAQPARPFWPSACAILSGCAVPPQPTRAFNLDRRWRQVIPGFI